MKHFVATLESVSPYFQSRSYAMEIERDRKESHDDFEKRTWRHRTHVNKDGYIVIPPDQFQFSIQNGAKYLSERIPGRGMETWTKHFMAGILVPEGITLDVKRDDVEGMWLLMDARGRREGNQRVWRCMPFVQHWSGDLTVHVMDDLITAEVLERVIEHAGAFVGIGQNRPARGGSRGRYRCLELVEIPIPLSTTAKAAE